MRAASVTKGPCDHSIGSINDLALIDELIVESITSRRRRLEVSYDEWRIEVQFENCIITIR
jgi:hypothetical protein